MNSINVISSILLILVGFFFVATFICGIVSVIYGEGALEFYFVSAAVCLVIGVGLIKSLRADFSIHARVGFIITAVSYIGLGLVGSIVFLVASPTSISFTDAVFEAVSGITTTGATVLTNLASYDNSLLFYRHLLQWIGGMGIILLAVAVLPMIGIGGMQMFRTESIGGSEQNLRPRIRETAQTLWLIYVGLTIICTLAYWLAGMSFFDAICHAFSTVAIGGFSTHDASIAYFDSMAVEIVCMVFMLVCAINFSLHFTAWRQCFLSSRAKLNLWFNKSLTPGQGLQVVRGFGLHRAAQTYGNDYELRLFFAIAAALIVLMLVHLNMSMTHGASENLLREAAFQAISFLTTSGFTTVNHGEWPISATILLILFACAGGCVGSTSGGLKMFRVLIMLQQGLNELYRLIYPNGVFLVKLHNTSVPDRVTNAVWGFFAVFVMTFLVLLVIVMFISDLDLITAFSAVIACLTNLGPGLGEVASNYQSLSNPVKWTLAGAMILGRLEIMMVLVLLLPKYWRV